MGVMYKLMKHKHSSLDMKHVLEKRDEMVTAPQDKKITAEHILQLCKFLAGKSKRNKQTLKKLKHLEYAKVTALEFDEVVEEMDIDIKVDEAALPLIKHNRLDNHHDSISSASIATATNMKTATTKTIARTTTTASAKQILKSKTVSEFSNNSNGSNISSRHYQTTCSLSSATPTTATCSMQYHQLQQQDSNKKDILQKIRSQIMERKRQRQLADMQQKIGTTGSVWRPW